MAIDIEILDAMVDVDSFWFSGVSAKYVSQRIRRHPDDELDVWINSPGGSASAGVTVANALAAHGPAVRVHVLGVAASAAGLVALGPGTDELRMPAGTFVMLHLPMLWTVGNAEQLRKAAGMLDQWTGEIADLLATGRLSDLSRDEIIGLMEAETWIGSAEMIAAGRAAAGAVQERHAGQVLSSLQQWSGSDALNEALKGWDAHVSSAIEAVPSPAAETLDAAQLARMEGYLSGHNLSRGDGPA